MQVKYPVMVARDAHIVKKGGVNLVKLDGPIVGFRGMLVSGTNHLTGAHSTAGK